MRSNLEKLYARAIKHAIICGFKRFADDFASWYALSLLEGRRQHQTIGLAFIDYLRQTRGNETNTPNARYHERIFGTQYEELEEQIADRDKHNNALTMLIENQEVQNLLSKLSKKDREVIELHFFDEITLKEIARVRGVTESRTSQIVKGIIKKLIAQTDLE